MQAGLWAGQCLIWQKKFGLIRAAADSWFSHLAFEVEGEETSNEWCEPVSDEEYRNVN